MKSFGYELEEEFNAVTQFVEEKYGIVIKSKEQLVDFTQNALIFMMSIKIWQKHLSHIFDNIPKQKCIFKKCYQM